jgi:hypothetical protein
MAWVAEFKIKTPLSDTLLPPGNPFDIASVAFPEAVVVPDTVATVVSLTTNDPVSVPFPTIVKVIVPLP